MPSCYVKTAPGFRVQIDQCDQHQQRTQQRIEEKLECSVNLVGAAPNADDEIHRYQRRFKKDVKKQTVEGAKNTNHQPAQNHERTHVLIDALGDDLPAGNHNNQIDESRKKNKPEGYAIYAQVIKDIKALYPRGIFNKLHGCST